MGSCQGKSADPSEIPTDKEIIDACTLTELEPQYAVCLHGGHYLGKDTLEMYLNTLTETSVSEIRIVKVVPKEHAKPVYDKRNWHIPCPAVVGDKTCQQTVPLRKLVKGLPEIGKKFSLMVPRLNRAQELAKDGVDDCPFCVDPTELGGIGYRLTADDRRYGHNFVNVRKCNTCQKIFCAVCREGYDESEHTHYNKTCWEVQELKKGEDPSRIYIESHFVDCPNCHVRIEKVSGCNRLQCRKCNWHFCFLCRYKSMNYRDIYQHFRESKCVQTGISAEMLAEARQTVGPDHRQMLTA